MSQIAQQATAENAVKQKLKKWQKIFVNRSLNMANIKTIGFDMDHTLITYNRENFEALAFRETLKNSLLPVIRKNF